MHHRFAHCYEKFNEPTIKICREIILMPFYYIVVGSNLSIIAFSGHSMFVFLLQYFCC